MARNLLFISDLQIPFEARAKGTPGTPAYRPGALEFCLDLKRYYQVADEDCYCVGDETDQYFASTYAKDPDAIMSPTSEIRESIERLQLWYAAFPKMKLAISNHGVRWWKRAQEAGIPSLVLKTYKQVIEAPPAWHWQKEWAIRDLASPVRMIHGMGYSGAMGHRTAALDAGVSTVIGHLHSHAGVNFIRTAGMKIWGMNVGSLIDVDAFAFQYGADSRFRPCLGAGIVANDGRTPIWVPYE